MGDNRPSKFGYSLGRAADTSMLNSQGERQSRRLGAVYLLNAECAPKVRMTHSKNLAVAHTMFGIYFWCVEICLVLSILLPPDATSLASRRTVLAWNGYAWYCPASTMCSSVKRACKNCTGLLSVSPSDRHHSPHPPGSWIKSNDTLT